MTKRFSGYGREESQDVCEVMKLGAAWESWSVCSGVALVGASRREFDVDIVRGEIFAVVVIALSSLRGSPMVVLTAFKKFNTDDRKLT